MNKNILLSFILMLMCGFVSAQEQVESISLPQAVDYALKNNKQLQSSRKNIGIYKTKVKAAISQGLPQVNASVDYNTNFRSQLNFGGNKMTLKDQSTFNASVNQLIFSGEWILGIQTSRVAEQMIREQVDLTELDVVENVHNAYYLILVLERSVSILNENLKNMNEILVHTENMYKAGVAESTDVDQLRINVGEIQNSLLSTQRTLDVNYNLLHIYLGLDNKQEIRLSERLDSFLVLDDFAKLAVQQFEMSRNAQYKLSRTQEALGVKQVGLKRWAFAPSIGANYNYKYQIIEGGMFNVPHTGGVTMTIPIFSGMQRKALLNQTKIELEQTQLNNSLLVDQLNLQNEQYKFDLRNALENYNLQKENIKVAGRVLGNFRHKFEQGVASSLDLTQANTNYLQAEINYNQACYTLLQAQTNLQKLYNELY